MDHIIGSKIISLQNTASTNIFALETVSASKPEEGTVVITHDQTEGRGMDSNTWESEPGMNLTFSIILYPAFLAADKQFYLSMATVLGITDMIRSQTRIRQITVKWPNDVYVDDKKISGILIQNNLVGNRIESSIIGIGLNVNQVSFLPTTANPTSLKLMTKTEQDLDKLFAELCASLDLRYQQLKAGKLQILKNDYLKNLYRRQEMHTFSIRGEICSATITGISDYGQLMLESEDGKVFTCDVKEVQYL